ncbi:alkaline phosphatase D family protein [Microlunatus sp. GCM10028923]|uniref:alkaline phosphatase D family protein n=1 Tax=Microlunatus sp. GCM10028923 TaxID=3273400 RepID=UPI0036164B91
MVQPARSGIRRRIFVLGGLATASASTLPGIAGATPATALRQDPFTLGVASGDPTHDGVVLWTRLAPEPLAEDGLGGMPNRTVRVQWELADDPRFGRVVRRGTALARPETAHSVHVELSDLRPDRELFYRFRAERYLSPTGRTRTAPDPQTLGTELRMGFVSCAQYEHGWFTAYRRLAEDHPDLILHLGDYQYEHRKGDYTIPGGNIRDHDGPETVTLANYRQRYAQYRTDPDLQAAHAAAPWLVVWDDHEVDNNWAGDVPENAQPTFLDRRTAAFRAYYENMPLRSTSVPQGLGMRLYRRLRWGRLANFHMLDTRQYRDDQACGDGWRSCPAAEQPDRSILGRPQEDWLIDGFRTSEARWDLLGQQVFFAQQDRDDGPGKITAQDAWDGYVASRRRITQGWIDAGVRNPVVLTGDVHRAWACDLKLDYDDPTTPSVGSELVCTSITATGDGRDTDPADQSILHNNPHLRFYNNLRGYVMTTITPDRLDADFRVLPTVSRPDEPIDTRASFAIEDRSPGLHQTYDRGLPD